MASRRRQCDALGNVLLGSVIHVDGSLTCTPYLSIVADHAHPFMETIFPDGCGHFKQDNVPCHKAKRDQEWPPNSGDVLDKSDPWRPHLATYRT